MAIQARLFDGTTLEFPDGTDPAVIDRVAAEETATRSKQAKQSPQAKSAEEPEKERSYFQAASDSLRQFADLAPSFGQGVVTAVESVAHSLPGRNTQAAITKPIITDADYETARNYLQGLKSERTQLAEQKPKEAEGFTDTLKAYLENPSAMVTGFGESLPAMLGGAGIARGLVTKSVPAMYAAATGEGTVGSLLAAENIRKSQGGEDLSLGQSALAGLSGIFTGVLGVVGNKVASKLGVADIDELLAAQKTGTLTPEAKSTILAATKGAIAESAFEELPQSVQEQILQNIATGRPYDEGVGEAAAAGLAVALVPGALGGGYGQYKTNQGIAREKIAADVMAGRTAEETQAEKERVAKLKKSGKLAEPNVIYEDKLNKLLGVDDVTGTNSAASATGANLSGEPDPAELEAGAGGADRSGVAGAGSDVGAAASGANAQSTTLSATEQPIVDAATQAGVKFNAPSHARNWVIKNVLDGDKAAAAQLEKDNPGVYKRLFETTKQAIAAPVAKIETIEAVKETPAFNETELQEAEEVVSPIRTASPEALAAKARRDTWLGKSLDEIVAQAKNKTPIEEVEDQQAEAEALADELVPSEEVSQEAAVETTPKAEEVIAEEVAVEAPVVEENLQQRKEKVVAKAKIAGGNLASKLTKGIRSNIVPEEETSYIDDVTALFSAAIEAGSISFQQASANVAEQLKEFGISIDDIKDYLEEAYSRASAGLRSKAKQKQEVELENKQIAFAADEPARAKILDEKEAERLDRVYQFNTDRLDNVTQEEIDGYQENHELEGLPEWNSSAQLNNAERTLYLEVNDTQGSAAAFEALRNFRKNPKSKVLNRTTDSNAAIYELNRNKASKELKIEFPSWQELSPEAQAKFLNDLPKLSKKKPTHSGVTLNTAFDNVAEQLEQEDVAFRGAYDIDIKNIKLAQQSDQAQEKYQTEEAKAREASAQAVGKGTKLSLSAIDALENDGINGVLNYLADSSQGLNVIQTQLNIEGEAKPIKETNAFKYMRGIHKLATAKIFKALAKTLKTVNFTSTVITDPNDLAIVALRREGKLAEYDPKTDTFYFTPEGLDESTILHEVIHAATVKIINQFKTNPASLTQSQRDAVQHLEKLFTFVSNRLGNKYPNAVENIYEFVAYAMTDFKFQAELAKLQVPRLGRYTLTTEDGVNLGNLVKTVWGQFTTALMEMHKLLSPKPIKLELRPDIFSNVAKDFATVKGSLDELYQEIDDENLDTDKANLKKTELSEYEDLEDTTKVPTKFAPAARLLSMQKGFESNILLEVAEVMNSILAAPEVGTEVEPLAAKAPKKPKKAAGATYPSADAAFNAEVNALNKKSNDKLDGPTKAEKFKHLMSNKVGSYRKAVKTFQNIAEPLKRWSNRLKAAGKLTFDENKEFDNVYDQLVGAAAKAHFYYGERVQKLEDTLMKQLSSLTTSFKTDAVDMLNKLQIFVTALHEPERRRLVFIKNVPLRDDIQITLNGVTDTPNNFRDYIFNALNNLTDSPTQTAREQAIKLRQLLDSIIFTDVGNLEAQDARDRVGKLNKNNIDYTKSKNPDAYNEDSDKYIVEAGYDPQRISQYLSVLNNSPFKQQIMDTLATVNEIEQATIELNKMGNYWSRPVDNRVAFYGFKHYVPFKGKPEKAEEANRSIYEPASEQSSRDLQFYMPSFTGGRSSTADNPIAQVVTDAKKSAFLAANNKVTQAVANAVKHGFIDTVNGKRAPTKIIPFEERYKGLTPEEIMAKNTVFNYRPDGTIEVYALKDQGILESLRQPYKIWGEYSKAAFRTAGATTRFIGQGFTRFNPFFAPWNAFRDTLTNLYNINVDMGITVAGKTLGNTIWYGIFETVTGGGMITSARVTRMYSKGDIEGVRKLAQRDSFAKNFLEYAESGGVVTYLQGVSNINQLRDMEKVMKRGSIALSFDQLKDIAAYPFDMWFNGFENTARVAAYAAVKDGLLAQGLPAAEAMSQASIYTKELANFEQTGKYGAEMGSLYMFARAQATGAVRAIDSLSYIAIPADKAAADLPESVRKDPAAMAKFKEEYNRRRIYSSVTSAALFGLGYMSYMMALAGAGDDDQDENITEKDDMARWVRALRIPIPGTDYMFQLPWGFGKGAFSAWGAQVAAFNAGTQSFSDMLGNSVTIGMESFIPIPASHIPVSKDVRTTAYAITDTVMPTVLRPVFEWMINMNGLGMEIQRLGSMGSTPDAFSSRVNIPQYYKDTAEFLFEESDGYVNVSPDLLHFLASSYINGISLLGQNLQNASILAAGDKEFNAKTDTFILNSFVGTRADFYSREFNRIEEEIKAKKERLAGFETLDKYNDYITKHPNDVGLIESYEKDVNTDLKKLRSERKQITLNRNISEMERTQELKDNKLNQQYIKAQLIAKYKYLDESLKTAIDKD